jgi:four helix bundle protein
MGQNFEDLQVWQRAQSLAIQVCQQMETCSNWGFRDQIIRSSISVPSNIAEGAERLSPKEFIQFLSYAKGSCGELRCQLLIGQNLKYFDLEQSEQMVRETREISRMIWGLMQSLRS